MLRLTFPRITSLLIALALVGYTFVLAPRLESAAGGDVPSADGGLALDVDRNARTPRMLFPPADKVFLGVSTAEGWHDFGSLDAFAAATRHRPSAMMFTAGWAVDKFNRAGFDLVARRGMLPVVSWEPWDHRSRPGADNSRSAQPRYTLARIVAGEYDAYIRAYAKGVRELRYEVGIRLAHEMNGFWYPWSEQSNGNRPGDYVRMWRHVHDIFKEVGAYNALWIWSPNVVYTNSTPIAALYPGDSYVDWIGLSGYYGTEGVEMYRGFVDTFERSITEVRGIARKPIVITEVGATDKDGRKAEWVTDMFAALPRYPDIIGVIWFEAVREADWRIAPAPAAAAAYAAGAAHARYSVDWSPATWARLEPPSPAPTSTTPSTSPSTRSTTSKPPTRQPTRRPSSSSSSRG
jgi:hypothetical protein